MVHIRVNLFVYEPLLQLLGRADLDLVSDGGRLVHHHLLLIVVRSVSLGLQLVKRRRQTSLEATRRLRRLGVCSRLARLRCRLARLGWWARLLNWCRA